MKSYKVTLIENETKIEMIVKDKDVETFEKWIMQELDNTIYHAVGLDNDFEI